MSAIYIIQNGLPDHSTTVSCKGLNHTVILPKLKSEIIKPPVISSSYKVINYSKNKLK